MAVANSREVVLFFFFSADSLFPSSHAVVVAAPHVLRGRFASETRFCGSTKSQPNNNIYAYRRNIATIRVYYRLRVVNLITRSRSPEIGRVIGLSNSTGRPTCSSISPRDRFVFPLSRMRVQTNTYAHRGKTKKMTVPRSCTTEILFCGDLRRDKNGRAPIFVTKIDRENCCEPYQPDRCAVNDIIVSTVRFQTIRLNLKPAQR